MKQTKKVLIVGAGAVGKVYAYYLSKSCDIGFLVKPQQLADMRQGFSLQHLNRDKKGQKLIFFDNYQTYSSLDINSSGNWDIIILALPSNALTSIEFDKIHSKNATVILLSPGQQDKSILVENAILEAQIVSNMVSMISFNADLSQANELEPKSDQLRQQSSHLRYYLPPFGKFLFSGSSAQRVDEVVKLFATTLPATACDSVFDELVHANILLLCTVLGLEKCDWSFAKLRQNRRQRQVIVRHIKAFNLAIYRHYQIKTPRYYKLITPFAINVALLILPLLTPFNLEAYLSYHYQKVLPQSLQHLQECVDICRAQNISYDLQSLTLHQLDN